MSFHSFKKTGQSFALLIAATVFGLTGQVVSAVAQDYAIVVNAANDYSASEDEMRTTVRRLYLKEQSEWPNGITAEPFAREADDPAHQAFLSNILGMSAADAENHWLRVKQTRGETPPRTVGSGRIIMRLIGRQDGAFGIVSAEDAEGAGSDVRILMRF